MKKPFSLKNAAAPFLSADRRGFTQIRSGAGRERSKPLPILITGACALLAAYIGGGAALAQTVTGVTARQRWPWSNLVDIDYTVEGATNSIGQADASGLYIRFEIEDPSAGGEREAAAFDREPPLTNGTHRVVWDPEADGIRVQAAGVTCRALLRRDAPDRYRVIDLSRGPAASRYPVFDLPAPPAGGWTDEYKTTKLVLRKVDPGTFRMGSPTDELGRGGNEDLHTVTLTEPFYIGVFEVTQNQYGLVTGKWPALHPGEGRPVERVSYHDIRGASPAVSQGSFMGLLRAKTGQTGFDLPTEAQWEYACRAGTETALNSGENLTDKTACQAMGDVGSYSANAGHTTYHTWAGSRRPNAWGLYDMHGNVWEWCLDGYRENLGGAPAENPAGPMSGNRVRRGGSWYNPASSCRSAGRQSHGPASCGDSIGFRAACAAEL